MLLVALSLFWANASAQDVHTQSDQVRRQMQHLAEREREHQQQAMVLLIKDLDRVGRLTEEQQNRLRIAAKGAVDLYLLHWRERLEAWVQARLTTEDPDLDELLSSMAAVRFGDARDWAPKHQPLWIETVNHTLKADQRQAYRSDLESRSRFKHQAMAQIVVADLDARIKLSPAQRSVLLPWVEAAAFEYWERLESWSGMEDNLPFHYLGAILGGIPETVLQDQLTQEQQEGFRDHFANVSAVWARIQDMDPLEKFETYLR